MAQVNLSVNGNVYRMACEDGEEDHVLQLGTRFDGAINELREAVGEIGDQRLLVMAGILMTDRLSDAESRLGRAEAEIRELRESRRETTSRGESVEQSFAARLEAAAERIERLVRRLQGHPRSGKDSQG